MYLNWERLSAVMDREDLDALVVSSYEHVLYASGFENRLPFATGTGAAAVVVRGEEVRGALIVAMPYLSHLVECPTWLPDVVVFGSIGIARNHDVILERPEAEVAAALDAWDGRSHANKAAAVASVLAAHGVTGRIAVEDPEVVDTSSFADVVPARALLDEVRLIKTPAEIDLIARACDLNELAFDNACSTLRAGQDWREVTRSWARTWAEGAGVPEFWGGGSGAHASQFWPHEISYEIRAGDVVRWEGGGTLGGYWADTGRAAIVGDGPRGAQERFEGLREGAAAVRRTLRAGVEPDEVCAAALDAIRSNGLPDFPTSNAWGHGIGLGLNEGPRVRPGSPATLEAGMVICFETPYFELGWGGLQLEDTYVITEDGFRQLTRASEELTVVS